MNTNLSGSSTTSVPIILSVIAVLIGGAGLYAGLSARTAAQEAGSIAVGLRDSVDSLKDRSAQMAGDMQGLEAGVRQQMQALVVQIRNLTPPAQPAASTAAQAGRSAAPGSAAAAAAPTAAAGEKIHTIKPGDNPAKLAKQYSVSVDAIMKANPGLNPSRIKVGQKIKIPVAVAAAR